MRVVEIPKFVVVLIIKHLGVRSRELKERVVSYTRLRIHIEREHIRIVIRLELSTALPELLGARVLNLKADSVNVVCYKIVWIDIHRSHAGLVLLE